MQHPITRVTMHSGLPDGLSLCPLPRCSFWSAPPPTLKISSLNNKFSGHPRVSLFFPIFGHTMQYAESESSDQGLNGWPLQWKGRVLTARPPWKSPLFFFFPQGLFNEKAPCLQPPQMLGLPRWSGSPDM